MSWTRSLTGVVLFGLAVAALGCGSEALKSGKPANTNSSPPRDQAQAPEPEPTGPFAAGMKVYAANDCKKCHSVDPSAGRGKAPNLGTVGKEHDATWLVAHVKNPQSHNPMSKMPAFDGKINDADLKSLGDYLASLK